MWVYEIFILLSAKMQRREITFKQPLSLGSALIHFKLATVFSTCFAAGNNSSEHWASRLFCMKHPTILTLEHWFSYWFYYYPMKKVDYFDWLITFLFFTIQKENYIIDFSWLSGGHATLKYSSFTGDLKTPHAGWLPSSCLLSCHPNCNGTEISDCIFSVHRNIASLYFVVIFYSI